MLKKESKKLLNDNGYSLKKETGSLVISHSNADFFFFILIGAFLVLIGLFFMNFSMVIGFSIMTGAIIIISKALKGARGKSVFKINYEKGWFYYNDAVKSSLSLGFSEVDGIACKSTFANEYSSANKSSSKEYHHQIFLELVDGSSHEIFLLSGEDLEPSNSVNDFIEELKLILKESQSQSHIE